MVDPVGQSIATFARVHASQIVIGLRVAVALVRQGALPFCALRMQFVDCTQLLAMLR